MKQLIIFLIVISLMLSAPSDALACDREQTEVYMLQILFGDSYLTYESNENVQILLDALYLCSEQSDNSGSAELNYLQEKKVSSVPSLAKITIQSDELYQCVHTSWEYVYANEKKKQAARKKLLRNSVNKVFDFGFINELLNNSEGKTNSFAAILYYSHILSDYLADDPEETETISGENTISSYSGQPYIEINGNMPSFSTKEKKSTEAFAEYSGLDGLGRCGIAYVNVCKDTMPSADSRQDIGTIKPSGWNQEKYPGFVNSNPPYLYNRCHLVAHQLAGNDTENNLITGTRYLNETGMLPFENKVAEYVKETENHVLYRATPVYKGDNLVASGVQLEAYSVEDDGEGICFNVYCYNVQPGVDINYSSGENEVSDETYGNDDILSFAVSAPGETSPDLIYEMNKYLELLFEDQTDSGIYTSMIQDIDAIANEARSICDQAQANVKEYQNLNSLEYKYLDVLRRDVPLLLEKEDFFNEVF